jgi:hypothetical protein
VGHFRRSFEPEGGNEWVVKLEARSGWGEVETVEVATIKESGKNPGVLSGLEQGRYRLKKRM